jgi:hypothetical protein
MRREVELLLKEYPELWLKIVLDESVKRRVRNLDT